MSSSLVTLFCGAGGLDLGFHMTQNVDLFMANEILETPLKSYSKNLHFPLVNLKDFKGQTPRGTRRHPTI